MTTTTSRRNFITGLLASLSLLLLRRAGAAHDLLDPDKVGATRRSAASERLLDPDRLGAKVVQSAGEQVRRNSKRQSTLFARSMASTVAGSLDGLIHSATQLWDDYLKLEAEERRLAALLNKLLAARVGCGEV